VNGERDSERRRDKLRRNQSSVNGYIKLCLACNYAEAF
jgi:hypothetical protein